MKKTTPLGPLSFLLVIFLFLVGFRGEKMVNLLDSARIPAKVTSSKESFAPFQVSDPLGININDIDDLNRMNDQPLLHLGFIDITNLHIPLIPQEKKMRQKPLRMPFFGRHHKLAVYFPTGDYLVSNTIPCFGGWSDERTPNHKYLPWIETWPCVLIGDRRTGKKPRIILAPHSPGFDDPEHPKAIFKFNARTLIRKNTTDSLMPDEGSTSYQQLFYGIDIKIGKGNKGAAAIAFNAAEGSSIQDCTFDVGDGFTGMLGGPGSGGAVFNVKITGGHTGMYLNSSRPTCVIAGCRFIRQRAMGISYGQRGPLVLAGCEFLMKPGVPALRVRSRLEEHMASSGQVLAGSTVGIIAEPNGSATLTDCRIEYVKPSVEIPAIQAEASVYIRNTWFRNVRKLICSSEDSLVALSGGKWTRAIEIAMPVGDYTKPMVTPVYVDGKRHAGRLCELEIRDILPGDLRKRHIWDETEFPYWDQRNTVNVKNPPYNAKGDGVTDDTEALQRAIDENAHVFLPKGAYKVTKTLKIKGKTQLFGISPSYCLIVPIAVEGGDFNMSSVPKPVIQINDDEESSPVLAFFSVFMPREQGKSCYMLDVAGRNTIVRCVLPIAGTTAADIDPLEKKIYPWTNWKWEDMESFALQTGFLKVLWNNNYWDKDGNAMVGSDSPEQGIPNWPTVIIHGKGSGRWYLFIDHDSACMEKIFAGYW